MKKFYEVNFIVILIAISTHVFSQVKVTQISGNWNNANIWSPVGVPVANSAISLNHSVNLNQPITISNSLTVSAPLTDIGTNSFTLNNAARMTLYANTTFNGLDNFIQNGVLIIKSGVTLTINGNLTIQNRNTYILIESGANLIVNGDVELNKGDIDVAGNFTINGSFQNLGLAATTVNKIGTGKFTTTGSMTSSKGIIYTKSNVNCPSNCDADNICTAYTLTLTTASVCYNTNATFTASISDILIPNGTKISYEWSTANTVDGLYTVQSVSNKNTFTINSSIPYFVKCKSTINGCTAEDIQQIQLVNISKPNVVNVNLCGAGTAVMSPSLTGVSTFRWYTSITGGTLLYTGSVYTVANVTTSTTYYVSSVTASGCESYERSPLSVFVNSIPTNVVGIDNSRCRAGSVALTATGSDNTYQWFSQSGTLLYTGNVFNTPSISTTTNYYVGILSNSGCTTPVANRDLVVATVNSTCNLTWNGSVNDSWNQPLNWIGNQIPTSTDVVTIPSNTTFNLNIQSVVNIKDLLVLTGAQVTVSPIGTINIFGNLSVQGSLNCSGELVFVGNTPQQITGVFPLSKLTINTNSTVTLSDPITVTKLLKLTQGELISNGKVSIDLNTGNIDGSGVGSIIGNITVYKLVPSFKTHYFACPLDGVTCQDLIDDAEVINPRTNLSRLFKLDYTTNKWVVINDMNTTLVKGEPYSLYFTTPTTLDFTGTYDHNYVQAFSVDNSQSNFYFIANPYPCSLDWDAPSGWTNKSALNNSISFWDGTNSKYVTYTTGAGINGATNIIPSMQGYWIQTTGSGGTFPIVIGKGAWISTENKSLWRTVDANDMYSITIRNLNNNTTDETIIRFIDGSTFGFDNTFDAVKSFNPSPTSNIFSTNSTSKFAIQSVPFAIDTIIPLSIKVSAVGTYELSTNYKGLYMGREAYLYDSLLGTFTPISQNLTLGFNSIQTTQRVSLVLKVAETTSISQTVNSTGNWYVYSNSNEYFLVNKENSKEKANITICSTDGNILLQENEAMFNNNIKQLQTENFKPGIYLLKINQKDKIQTIKFVIQ